MPNTVGLLGSACGAAAAASADAAGPRSPPESFSPAPDRSPRTPPSVCHSAESATETRIHGGRAACARQTLRAEPQPIPRLIRSAPRALPALAGLLKFG